MIGRLDSVTLLMNFRLRCIGCYNDFVGFSVGRYRSLQGYHNAIGVFFSFFKSNNGNTYMEVKCFQIYILKYIYKMSR